MPANSISTPARKRWYRAAPTRSLAVAGLTLALLHPSAATASPLTVGGVDSYSSPSSAACTTVTRPGTSGVAEILRASYPGITASTAVRGCDTNEYVSDHARGLAIDWSVPSGAAQGQQVLDWLFQPDASGNAHVRLRRLGISYIIWDNKIWKANNTSDRARTSDTRTWRAYDSSSCTAKYGASADCGHVRHMHLSLGDAGGAKSTSWWQSSMNGHRDTPTSGSGSTPVAAPPRIATVAATSVRVKEGAIGASWTPVIGSVDIAEVVTTPTRIAVLTKDGRVFLKDGPINAPWAQIAAGVVDVDLAEDRIGIVTADGAALVKEGPYDAVWTTVAAGSTTAIDLAGSRVGIVINGWAMVKEGPLNATWTKLIAGVDELVLDGDRIAARHGGAVSIKEGPVNATWTTVIAGGALDIELGGGRVAVRTSDKVLVKEGALNSYWTTVIGPATSVAVTADRVGVVLPDGSVHVKEGALHATWTTVDGGAIAVELS